MLGSDRYSLCFQNNYKNGDDDEYGFDIGFNVRIHTPPRALDEQEEGPDNERATKLVEKAARIHEDWDVLRDHFDFLRNREGIQQRMNDQIMNRLARWNTIEGLLVVAIATAQIMYFRAFFEKRRYL
jgi:emp24/gp25L/p24 family/GOLD